MVALLVSLGTTEASQASNYLTFANTALGAVTFALIGAFICQFKPSQRGVLELAGTSAVLTAAVAHYLPIEGVFFDLFGLGMFLFFISILWSALASKRAKKIGASTTVKMRYTCTFPYAARLVWRHLVPNDTIPGDHFSKRLSRYSQDDEDPDTYNATIDRGDNRSSVYAVTLLEQKAPKIFRAFYLGEESDGTLVDGIVALNVMILDSNLCQLIWIEERSGLSLWAMIERWFDNPLKFQTMNLRTLLDRKYSIENSAFVDEPDHLRA